MRASERHASLHSHASRANKPTIFHHDGLHLTAASRRSKSRERAKPAGSSVGDPRGQPRRRSRYVVRRTPAGQLSRAFAERSPLWVSTFAVTQIRISYRWVFLLSMDSPSFVMNVRRSMKVMIDRYL
ncbi:hypothetical protein EVAR_38431_1 [Eumeta japonica]|uniref:Uncharacterized protein n=1 Tax=Eumeta variegata TaxID=151549 RepID=A0A4C1X0F5_EUMVA|nr:hypothetical protein EVAR_38431_1 [Eumeta japonica]